MLSASDARLIVQTRVLGFDIGEIAHQIGMTPGSVRQRRSRAEARLAASIA
jgi:DNA-directed RNA polymerase specialized sigma24 family protein